METGDRLTWTQRRELERELWLDAHLRALAGVRSEDLDDPAALAAIEARARALAEVVAKLRTMRGDEDALDRAVMAFRGELERLG
jgi:ethanolamine utilization microcompartment shell protein EutL